MARNKSSIAEEVEKRLKVEQMTWRQGHYDFCLIHSERDMRAAVEFRDSFCKEYNVVGIMESDEDMCSIPSEIERVEEMLKRSTKIFLFITEHFNADKMCLLQKNELLAMHLRSNQHIVPIYTERRFLNYAPFGLTGMVGFKTYLEHKDKRRIVGTFSECVRNLRIAREADEKRSYEDKTSDLRGKFHREVQEEIRQCKNKLLDFTKGPKTRDTSPSNVAVQSTNYTQIKTAGSVINGPVFNIKLEEGATLNLDPVLRQYVKIHRPDGHDETSSDEDSNNNDDDSAI